MMDATTMLVLSSLLNVKKFLFGFCILSCCFITDLTVEVTSENAASYFIEFIPDRKKTDNVLDGIEREIYTRSNEIEKFSPDAMKNLTNFQSIVIRNCMKLSTIPENLFHGNEAFKEVLYLGIHNTGITHFPENLFSELVQVKFISLYNHKLTSLHPNLFQSNLKLNAIAISKNKILLNMPAGLFRNNRELSQIMIPENPLLKRLPRQPFFPDFKKDNITISLDSCSLRYIPHEIFASFDFSEKEYHLNISHNYLVCLPDYFLDTTRIPEDRRKNIDLSRNCFDESSKICELFKCKNRHANECEDVKTANNIKGCQAGYEESEDEVKNDKGNIGFTILYILIFCIIAALLVVLAYFGYKRGWISSLKNRLRSQDTLQTSSHE